MTDYTRYEPDIDDQNRTVIRCEDCDVHVWTEDDAAEQVTQISLANWIAHADEHEQKHHAEPEDIPFAEYGDIDGEDWPR